MAGTALKHADNCCLIGGKCHCQDFDDATPVPAHIVAPGADVSLADELEGFLVTLPGWLIEPVAMKEILRLLHLRIES